MHGLSAGTQKKEPLWRGGRSREVKTKVNAWTVRWHTKKEPLWRGGHCREVKTKVNARTVRWDTKKGAVMERWPF